MITVNAILFIVGILSIAIGAIVVLYTLKKEKETFNIMNEMLDSAINNSFSETIYDETSLSALESKLNRFLMISKSSERNILEERKKIKELVSDISHQTKTPISNILLYSQLLLEEEGIPKQSKKLIEEITTQSEKLSFLIQALVKTSRLETGIVSVNPKASSVDELIASSVNAIKQKLEKKNITLTLAYEKNLCAYFDGKWTEEAVINILDNAVKYTPAGGTISISTAVYELFTRIDIQDNGFGIEKEEVNRIFQRFYRSQSVAQYEGVGIGLYLAREILSAEGGYIKVESSLGQGSTFSIFLPNVKIST